MNRKPSRGIGVYIVILAMLMMTIYFAVSMMSDQDQPKYYEIISYFEKEQVQEFTLNVSSGEMSMRIQNDAGQTAMVSYRVASVNMFYEDTKELIQTYNKNHPDAVMKTDFIRPKDAPWWLSMLPYLLLIGAMVFLWFMMMRQAGGGAGKAMSFAKAKVRTAEDGKKTTFADVAGADEEKAELVEIVEFLKNPKKFNELGARIPKGVMLMGPPGTGKTLLARAVAGEAGVPFFSISGSDFVEMFVGVGASRVRDLFEQAKKNAPSIVFIDEIDAVGRHRGAGLGGGHDEREQTLNQLLVEMDGFAANEGVVVLAATNRADVLDPALLRPGRFDRQIVVGRPDVGGREEILKVHTRNKPIGPDVDLSVIAKTTVGFTGADLENLMNEAALLAARRNRKAITMQEVQEATIKVVAGPEKKSHKVSDKDKKLTAYHEAGHAVCTYYCPTQDPVHMVSIIPRGMAGGFTMSLPVEDSGYETKRHMNENLTVLLGGRMAEKLVLDDISTGASNDLERASKIARSMVTRYGFSEKLGPVVYGQDEGEIFLGRDISQNRNYSENVAAEIDVEVRELVDNAYESAKGILTEHMDQLHLVAKYVYHHEKIDGDTFKKIMTDQMEWDPEDLAPLPGEEQEQPAQAPQEETEDTENSSSDLL